MILLHTLLHYCTFLTNFFRLTSIFLIYSVLKSVVIPKLINLAVDDMPIDAAKYDAVCTQGTRKALKGGWVTSSSVYYQDETTTTTSSSSISSSKKKKNTKMKKSKKGITLGGK